LHPYFSLEFMRDESGWKHKGCILFVAAADG